nr:TIGR02679 family protein [Glycomyces amatae]
MSSGRPVASIRLRGLTEPQQHAIAEALGLDELPSATASLGVAMLESRIGDLRAVVTELVGPLGDAAGDRARKAADREALWQWFEGHELLAARPALREWAGQVRAAGIVDSVDRTRSLLEAALRVLAVLPVDGVALPVLADRCFGDPHRLDKGRLPGMVLKAIAVETGAADPVGAEDRRRLWESAGVVRDQLSSQVLAAGIRPGGDGALAVALRALAGAGHAAAVTLAQVRAVEVLAVRDARTVSVVENPSVVQAALAAFGPSTPPLVCVSGWPSAAAIRLLDLLGRSGSPLRYHGDFDPAGIRIAAMVMERFGARPWRMGATDYLAAPVDGVGFAAEAVCETPWDPALAVAMRRRLAAVSEEQQIEALLADLA